MVKDADGAVIKDDLTGSGDVDAGTPGEYTLSYSYMRKTVRRQTLQQVVVVDTTAPEVELKPDLDGGSDIVKVTVGDVFEDPGLTLTDAVDKEASFWTSLQIPTDGLLAYYRFDESAGAVAHEDWNGYHASLQNMTDANHVDGKKGKLWISVE